MTQPSVTPSGADKAVTDYVLQLRWSVPPARVPAFDRWYAQEHLADMVAVPGIVLGQRLERVSSFPFASPTTFEHLTLYSVASPDVFATEEYRRLAQTPSPLTLEVTDGLGLSRGLYHQRFPAAGVLRGPGAAPAVALLHIMTGCLADVEEDFNRWYDEEHLPAVVNVPGVISGRRLRIAEGSEPVAGERMALSSLALYELEEAAVATSDALLSATRPTPWRQRIGDGMEAHVQLYLPRAGLEC
jgi:hypothetical protein